MGGLSLLVERHLLGLRQQLLRVLNCELEQRRPYDFVGVLDPVLLAQRLNNLLVVHSILLNTAYEVALSLNRPQPWERLAVAPIRSHQTPTNGPADGPQ